MKIGGYAVLVPAKAFPDLRPEPEIGDGFVRFRQTAGGRPGLPSPRLVREAPFVKIAGPTVWTTLMLTLHADGRSSASSSAPRRSRATGCTTTRGALVGKSAVIDFKEWYQHSFGTHSPWGDEDNAVPTADAETALERRLSTIIMRHGETAPKPVAVKAGGTIFVEGERGDDLALVLDGAVDVDVARRVPRAARAGHRARRARRPGRRGRAPRRSPPRPTAASCASAAHCSTTTTSSSSSRATAAKTSPANRRQQTDILPRAVTPVRVRELRRAGGDGWRAGA